jgi:hypothetical protein
MIVYVLFVHKKSVSKRKVCIIFIKNKKNKKIKKNILVVFLGGFFCIFCGFFWVGFLWPTLGPGPLPLHRAGPQADLPHRLLSNTQVGVHEGRAIDQSNLGSFRVAP